METTTRQVAGMGIKTNPLFPGVSVIELAQPFGVMRGELIRHWAVPTLGHWSDGSVWYEFVLRGDGATYRQFVDRKVAAIILRLAARPLEGLVP